MAFGILIAQFQHPPPGFNDAVVGFQQVAKQAGIIQGNGRGIAQQAEDQGIALAEAPRGKALHLEQPQHLPVRHHGHIG